MIYVAMINLYNEIINEWNTNWYINRRLNDAMTCEGHYERKTDQMTDMYEEWPGKLLLEMYMTSWLLKRRKSLIIIRKA